MRDLIEQLEMLEDESHRLFAGASVSAALTFCALAGLVYSAHINPDSAAVSPVMPSYLNCKQPSPPFAPPFAPRCAVVPVYPARR